MAMTQTRRYVCISLEKKNKMLELLLTAGAQVNARNIVGDAPLHKAALNGRTVSADILIRAGADVNIRCGTLRGGGV